MTYQSVTGQRVFMFTLAAVYAATPEAATEYATEHNLLGMPALADFEQLSLDMQEAYRYMANRPHGFE